MKNKTLHLIAGTALAISLTGPLALAQDTKSADKTFVKNALEGSLAEVNYGKLALQKSKDKNVTEFATKMVEDHQKLIADMKPLAKKLGVTVPSGPPISDRAKYTAMKMKSGSDFDYAYVEAMVKDHHQDLQ